MLISILLRVCSLPCTRFEKLLDWNGTHFLKILWRMSFIFFKSIDYGKLTPSSHEPARIIVKVIKIIEHSSQHFIWSVTWPKQSHIIYTHRIHTKKLYCLFLYVEGSQLAVLLLFHKKPIYTKPLHLSRYIRKKNFFFCKGGEKKS